MDMNIGFATMEKIENRLPGSIGSSRIRAQWLCNYWKDAEIYKVGKKYDVMIFQKAYWQQMLESFPGVKIFDLCDPDWLVPRPVVQVMDYCDAMVTSTEALATYLRNFIKKPVICIPDRVDLHEHNPRGVHEGRATKVGWFGYAHNMHYIQKCFGDLLEKNLELVIISDIEYVPPMGYENLHITNVKYNYENVHDELKKCDMLLLPDTNDDIKGRFKSNNKTLTGYALGLPVAKLPEDLDRFMNPDERNQEMEMRLKEVREKWDVRLSVEEYKTLIKSL